MKTFMEYMEGVGSPDLELVKICNYLDTFDFHDTHEYDKSTILDINEKIKRLSKILLSAGNEIKADVLEGMWEAIQKKLDYGPEHLMNRAMRHGRNGFIHITDLIYVFPEEKIKPRITLHVQEGILESIGGKEAKFVMLLNKDDGEDIAKRHQMGLTQYYMNKTISGSDLHWNGVYYNIKDEKGSFRGVQSDLHTGLKKELDEKMGQGELPKGFNLAKNLSGQYFVENDFENLHGINGLFRTYGQPEEGL